MISALLTMIGTWSSIKSTELEYPISNYSRLLVILNERIKHVIREDKKYERKIRSQKKWNEEIIRKKLNKRRRTNDIKFVSYFTLPGLWQVERKNIRDEFESCLTKAAERDLIEIITLTTEDHNSLTKFMGTKKTPVHGDTVKPKAIEDFNNKTKTILAKIERKKLKSWNALPYYYFFFVEGEWAIIVTPVGLPKLPCKSVPAEAKSEDAIVSTLGFYTTDLEIIGILRNKFTELKQD